MDMTARKIIILVVNVLSRMERNNKGIDLFLKNNFIAINE